MYAKKILITGISGFIAKHCAIELLRHGYRVRGTLRSQAKQEQVHATLGRHCDVSGLELVQADLLADAGWDDAMAGLHGVLHVASPFPFGQPRDPDALIRPAVDGTMRVLRAAAARQVPRFVQTSSSVAIVNGHPRERTSPCTEDDWTVLDAPGVDAYARSKTLAERAARAFIAEHRPPMHFCTVNPGFVLGPLLDQDIGTSGEIIRMFLRGKYPGAPRLSFPVVDVRDVARMHRLALETGEPSGGRYLGASECGWFIDIMRPIKAGLGDAARKVPSRELPDMVVRLIALFDSGARSALPMLGHRVQVDNSRTRRALGMEFIPLAESAPAMAASLVELDLV